MQKKLLLSLVCTVPAALPALANVALTVPDAKAWENPAIGDEFVNVSGTTVTCKVGVGSVSQEVKGLPAGQYKISFSDLKNVSWSVAGATVTVDKDDEKVGTFELVNGGDITITMAAVNPSLEFGFTEGRLTFVEDFSKKGEELAADLAEAYENYVALQGTPGKELKDEEKAITDEYAALTATINALAASDKNADEAVSVADLIKIYTSQKATSFTDLFNKINARIAALKTAVDTFKPKADAWNKSVEIANTNAANQAALNSSINALLNAAEGETLGVNVLIGQLNAEGTNADVKKANLPGATKILNDINTLKTSVANAFKGATTVVDITGFEKTIADLTDSLNKAWAKYQNDVQAVVLVDQIVELYNTLQPQNAYLNAVANIGTITDSKNYSGTDVYASNKTVWLTELQTINGGIPVKPVKTVNGKEVSDFELVDASLGVDGYTQKINDAVAAMNKVVTDAKAFAETQNNAYDAGYNLYAAKKTGWDAVMADYKARVNSAMPAKLNEQYQALLDAADKAIAAFKTYLNDTYSKTALPGESYTENVNAVETALSSISTFLLGDYGKVTGLQADLDKIKTDNAASFKDLNGTKYPEYAVPVNKFDSQYAAIQAAIDKIIADMNADKNFAADPTAVSETETAITNLTQASTAFFTAFGDTHDELIKALDNLAAFKTVIDAKYCAKTGGKYISGEVTDYTTLRDAFEMAETGFRARYLAAAAAVGNASLEQAKDLADALNGQAAAIVAAQNTWNTTATQANLDFAKGRLAELQKFMADHANLTTSVKFTEIDTALGKVEVPADGNTAKCTAADKAVEAQMAAMNDLYVSVTNYNAVSTVLGEIPAAAAAATAANNRINGAATTVVEFYQTEIDGYANVTAIQQAIDNAFNSKTGVTNDIKTTQLAAAQNKLNSLKAMEEKMQANWTNYSNQINDSAITRNYVQAILDNIKEAEYQGIVADWIKQLEELLNVRLIANDVKVTENYGKGNSVAANDEITAEYQAIRVAADAIAAQYEDQYNGMIIEQNNALTGEFSAWGKTNKELNDGYLEAVNLYNFYKNQLTEKAGYRAWMLDEDGDNVNYNLVANYAEVYDVLPAIQSLNTQISALISKANAAKEYLPESEQFKDQYDALVAAQAAELTKLQTLYTNLNNDANAAAQQYYAAKTSGYAAEMATSINTLEAAGLTHAEAVAGLKGISDILAQAAAYLESDELTLTYGEAMNVVARDKFANIDFPVAVTAAVNAKWAAEYDLNYNGRPGKEATETEPAVEAIPSVAELRGTLVENGAVQGDLTKFDAVVKKMVDLNTKATTVNEKDPLIGHLSDYITELEGYRAQLESMVQDAENNQQYKDTYDKYMEEVAGLQEIIDSLEEYIAGFTLNAPVSVATEPQALLDALKTQIGDKPSSAIKDITPADIENAKDQIMAAIDAKKEAADQAGLATLKTWIENTKVAYNTAVANGAAIADLAEEYNTIQTVEAWWQEYAGRGDKNFANDFAALVSEQLDTVLEVYKKLNPDGAASDLAAIQQALDDQKSGIDDQIEDAIKALDELVDEKDPDYAALVATVHAKLDPEFNALTSELETLKGQWMAEGDKLLVNSYEYEDAMDVVEGKISGISAKGADTLAAARKSLYNQQSAASLTAEWTKLDTFYKEVTAQVENYGLGKIYGRQIGVIETMLTDLKAAIDADAKAENLTKGLVLVNQVDGETTIVANYKLDKDFNGNAIQGAIESMAAEATQIYASGLEADAKAALDATYEALVGKYFINGYSLKQQYKNLKTSYIDNYDEFIPYGEGYVPVYSNMEAYEKFIAAFQGIIDGAKQIVTDSENQQYVPGVVVDREAEKVSAQDVMKLVDWVGNGVTYNELAANEETAWQAAAADLDFNGSLNIADINNDIQLMLGRKPAISDGNQFNPVKKPAAVANDANCTLAYLGEVDGNDRYAVVVNNPTAFIGGQFDIKLPVGMTLVGVSATERTQGHEVMSFEHDAYTTRVLIFDMENAEIAGNNGAMVYIDVQGHGSFSLDQVLFTDRDCHLHGFGNPGTSGIIDAIIDGAGAAKEAIYDAAGRMYDRVQRGINIIRHSDGSVTKELRK